MAASCVSQEAAGLQPKRSVTAYYLDRNQGQGLYSGARIERQVRVSFLPAGIRLAHALRAWKMQGGTYATFRPDEAPA